MRVALVSSHFVQYGIELAKGLAGNGAEVGIAFNERNAEKLVGSEWRAMLGDQVQHLAMPGRHSAKPWTRSALRNLRWFPRMLREFRPDVLHVQSSNDFPTLWTAWRTKLPLVVTVHDITAHPGEDAKAYSTRMQWLVDKVMMPRARKRGVQFITHGDILKRELVRVLGADAEDVHVVPHGILAGFAGPGESLEGHGTGEPPGPALFFGRMERYKGLHVLAAALPQVFAALPEARVVIAGRGPALEEVRADLTRHPQVELRDRYIETSEVADLYRAASVNLAPYVEASQSGVIASGYAFGVPAIASRTGALPEVVVDGDNGLLVEPGNADGLAAAMIRYLGDAALRARLHAGVRRWAEGPLSWSDIGRKTLEVYRRAGR